MTLTSDLVSELRENPKFSVLARRLRKVVSAAFAARRVERLTGAEVAELDPDLEPLTPEDAETPWGNLLLVLDRGPRDAREWSLLAALWAFDSGTAGELDRDIAEGLWLATATPLAPLGFADRLWTADARKALWERVVGVCLNAATAPAERIALAAALSLAASEEATDAAARLFEGSSDPAVRELIVGRVAARDPLSGELSLRRGRLRTVLLAVTGLLLLASAVRVILRVVLGMRRQVTLALQPGGVALTEATVLLGRPFRTRERFLPSDQIRAIERETRHAGMGLYAGLGMLAVGTYVGTGLLADAVRAPGGSPSLLGTGLLAIALGLLLDFLLFRFSTLRAGAARVAIEPRRGPAWVVAGSDPKRADAWLERFARLRGSV